MSHLVPSAPRSSHSVVRSGLTPRLATGVALALLATCAAPPDEPPTALEQSRGAIGQATRSGCFPVDPTTIPDRLDARRSLAVTEISMLRGFGFERVMTQLATQIYGRSKKAADDRANALRLFAQWWETQSPGPGNSTNVPHCDDTRDATGRPTKFGYPYDCRPAPSEGGLASVDPFVAPDTNANAYLPIGLFNRFDLAPASGAHCGEHRIVFAKRSGVFVPADGSDNLDRNLVIFEAAVPNPSPAKGIAGCFPIAAFWGYLSSLNDPAERAALLEKFYFSGVTSFDENKVRVNLPPVVHADNLGLAGRGQIRTNQFVNATPKIWTLREYKLQRLCATGPTCTKIVPVTVKTNPFGGHFDPRATDVTSQAFQAWFPAGISGLLGTTIEGFDFGAGGARYDSGQSLSSVSAENRYAVQLNGDCQVSDGQTICTSAFRSAIQTVLTDAGSALTPQDVVLRAQTQSCAGCHQLNNSTNTSSPPPRTNNAGPIGGGLTWPASLRFVHVSEQAPEKDASGTPSRYRISPALSDSFLPHRLGILASYLQGTIGCTEDVTARPSLGGSRTH